MKFKKGYTAYLIPEKERNKILSLFSPSFEKLILHHITHEFDVYSGKQIPDCRKAKITGYVKYVDENNKGIEIFIVSVCGKSRRPDGNLYHITFSLSESKYKPFMSNRFINSSEYDKEYKKLKKPLEIEVEPVFIEF